MLRRLFLPFLAALALLAGCGGGDEGGGAAAGGDSAAGVVPAGVALYLSVNADIDSDQWKQLRELVRRFPDGGRLGDQILSSLASEGVDWERDVDPALGPEVAVVMLPGSATPTFVGLTKPDDKAKLDALLAKGNSSPSVTAEIEGWTVFADKQASIDAFEKARDAGTLGDDEAFSAAVDGLPDESLATMYLDGEGLGRFIEQASQGAASAKQFGEFDWFAGAITSEGDGVRFEGVASGAGAEGVEPYTPELLSRVPAGSIAVLSFKGQSGQISKQLRDNPALGPQVAQIEQALGVELDQIAALFEGEGVIYVRTAAPLPEITAILDPADAAQARATLDTLVDRAQGLLGQNVEVRREGDRTEVDFGDFSVFYGITDDLVVASSQQTPFRGGPDRSLDDDEGFAAAKEASGLGDQTNGFLYLDFDALIPLIEGFAGAADQQLPPEVTRNLEPLDSLLFYGERDGNELKIAGFLGVK